MLAAKHATTTLPIVINGAGMLVEQGIFASLAHPGGNVTGVGRSGGTTVTGQVGRKQVLAATRSRVSSRQTAGTARLRIKRNDDPGNFGEL